MVNLNKSSYARILKSSALVGGAQGIDVLIRMLRVKVIAILLGPSGVGLIGLFQAAIDLIGKITRFGIGTSAVRQVAEANSVNDKLKLGRTLKTISRTCWITGILGWGITIGFAKPLSVWTFGTDGRSLSFVLLGSVLFIAAFYETKRAVLQGLRRIKELALVMVLASVFGTIFSILLYATLGEKGIVIALPVMAGVNFIFSWWYERKLDKPSIRMSWKQTIFEAKPLMTLGFAFMWSGILTAGMAFITRSLIVRTINIDSAGIYQAAWGISGLFAGFILNAMGKDFYPSLSEVAYDNDKVNSLVNEQIEIGILIALPGLLATLAYSPLVISVFYTSKFIMASEMLPWFVIGIYGRVISWPIGFIQMAKGASVAFLITETVSSLLHFTFIYTGLHYFSLIGVAMAFPMLYLCYTVMIYFVAKKLSGYKWSKNAQQLIAFSLLFIGTEFGILYFFEGYIAAVTSFILVCFCGLYCLKQITIRLGPNHRITKAASYICSLRFKT